MLEAEIGLSEQQLTRVQLGQVVHLKARALPLQTLTTVVARIAPAAERRRWRRADAEQRHRVLPTGRPAGRSAARNDRLCPRLYRPPVAGRNTDRSNLLLRVPRSSGGDAHVYL